MVTSRERPLAFGLGAAPRTLADMTIPVDSEGRFEAVTSDGVVFGEGTVEDGWVEFHYGDHDDGERPHTLEASTDLFEETWVVLPQASGGELRTAGG